MFSSRKVDWRQGSAPLAGYYEMSSLPKELKGIIELNPENDTAILHSRKTTIWPKNKELDLGKSSVRSEYRSILIWSNLVREVAIPIKYKPPEPNSPVLRGGMKVGLKVNGDLGASRLVDGYFSANPSTRLLDGKSLSSLVKSLTTGKVNSLFEGLSEHNLRDPGTIESVNEAARSKMSEMLSKTGLEMVSLRTKWERTGGEKLGQKQATISRRKEVLETLVEEKSLEEMMKSDRMDALKESRTEAIATEYLKEDEARVVAATESAKRVAIQEESETKRAVLETELELEDLKQERRISRAKAELNLERERKRQEMDLAQQRVTTDIANREMELDVKKKGLEIELERKERESQIRSGEKRVEIDSIVDAALKLKGGEFEETTIKDLLRPEGKGGKSYSFSEVINTETMDDLREGIYSAEEIDGFISELERMTKNPGNSKQRLSDIWAGLAVFHRHRGNKQGSMDQALQKSLRFNEGNPIAMKCRLEYLWNRQPQQFLPGKVARFKDQLEEIEAIVQGLIDSGDLAEEEVSVLRDKHKKCLKALSRDENEGSVWGDKMDALYGMEV